LIYSPYDKRLTTRQRQYRPQRTKPTYPLPHFCPLFPSHLKTRGNEDYLSVFRMECPFKTCRADHPTHFVTAGAKKARRRRFKQTSGMVNK
jgi:hypothetical protein